MSSDSVMDHWRSLTPKEQQSYQKASIRTELSAPELAFSLRNAKTLSRPCGCGSGKYPYEVTDARGIFCCFACDDCRRDKTRHFRQEIFSNPNYETDEPVDGDY